MKVKPLFAAIAFSLAIVSPWGLALAVPFQANALPCVEQPGLHCPAWISAPYGGDGGGDDKPHWNGLGGRLMRTSPDGKLVYTLVTSRYSDGTSDLALLAHDAASGEQTFAAEHLRTTEVRFLQAQGVAVDPTGRTVALVALASSSSKAFHLTDIFDARTGAFLRSLAPTTP